MAAGNDLSIDAYADIEEMKQGFAENGAKQIFLVKIRNYKFVIRNFYVILHHFII
ncbi:hypothetical protein FACS189430_01140 [Bacteroidia bacterium]|nr:hypothetical protein FACS189430_01140 [Bacteroidia bacterium]